MTAKLLRWIEAQNPVAALALFVIFAGLVAGGANTPALSAALSALLLIVLAMALVAAPSSGLAGLVSAHALTLGAAVALFVAALLSAAPLPSTLSALADPAMRTLNLAHLSASLSPASTIEGATQLIGAMGAFALGAVASLSLRGRDSVGRLLSWFTIAYAFYALFEFTIHQSGAGSLRLDAHVSSANAAAALFGVLALFAFAMILRTAKRAARKQTELDLPGPLAWLRPPLQAPLSTAALVLALTCALLTGSRGGLAAVLFGFAAFGLLILARSANKGRVLLGAMAIAAIGAGVWLFAHGGARVEDRLNGMPEAINQRQMLLQAHWRAFLERPLLGHGLNTFHELNAMAATPVNHDSLASAGAAHNVYVQTLEETGIIGGLLRVLMIGPVLLYALTRALKDRSQSEWRAALYGAALIFLIHGVIDFDLQIPAVAALFAFVLALFGGPSIIDVETDQPAR